VGTLLQIADGSSALIHAALNFVYPPSCQVCGAIAADARAERSRICHTCTVALAPPVANRCRRCDAPIGPNLDSSTGCVHCRNDRFSFAPVITVGKYDGVLREACLTAKRRGGAPLAASLASLLIRTRGHELRLINPQWVLPVPHHWSDRLLRPHLAPVTISRTLSRTLKACWSPHILAKRRRTPSQVSLTASARRQNLRRAFVVRRPRAIKGMRVLLVDDVLTTGTTAQRASRALLEAGAASVAVAAIARGLLETT